MVHVGSMVARVIGRWRSLLVGLALLVPFLQSGQAYAQGVPGQGMLITAYCDAGRMADGNWVHPGAAAGGWDLPFGSLVQISGMGVFMVEDRGGAVHPGHIDVWMGSCDDAMYFGREWRTVQVQRYGWWGA